MIDNLIVFRPAAARSIAAAIDATITRLGEQPFSGRVQEGGDVRKAITLRYGILIYYRVREVVEIITLQSGLQDREHRDA